MTRRGVGEGKRRGEETEGEEMDGVHRGRTGWRAGDGGVAEEEVGEFGEREQVGRTRAS